jgi:hypothetical protein
MAELHDYIAAQRDGLRIAADSIPRDRWHVHPGDDRWSVSEVLEHLATIEQRIAALIEKLVRDARANGLPVETEEGSTLDAVRLAQIQDRRVRIQSPPMGLPSGQKTPDELLAALDRSRAALTTAMAAADGLAIGTLSYPHLYFGPLTLYEWISFTGAHEARHAAQIREIGDALT